MSRTPSAAVELSSFKEDNSQAQSYKNISKINNQVVFLYFCNFP